MLPLPLQCGNLIWKFVNILWLQNFFLYLWQDIITCLKLLYSSKGMCRIDSQLKKLIRLKYLILETPYTFFSIFSWYFIVLHTLNFLSPMFSGINNNNFSFFGFSNLSFFVFVFTTLKKKIFLNIFSIDLILFQVKAL